MGPRRFVETLDRRVLLAIDAVSALTPLDADSEVITQSAAIASADDSTFSVYADRDVNTGKGNEVWMRRYDANGNAVSTRERVNTTTSGAQMNVDIAVLDADNYAVVWQSESQDGSGWGVYARVHSVSGWSSEVRVNQTTAGDQVTPRIAMTGNGCVVTWLARDENGGNGEIYARSVGLAGETPDDEAKLTAGGNLSVSAPDVAAGGSLGFTWVSADLSNAGQTDVRFAQYDEILQNPQGATLTVNTVTSGDQAEPAIAALPGTSDFVVVFSDNPDGSVEAMISFRRMTGLGPTTYPQRLASQDSDGNRSRPRIAAGGGNVVVGWTQTQDGAFYNQTATRMYDAGLTATSNESFVGDGSTMRTLFGLAITDTGRYVEVATQGEFTGSGVGYVGSYANYLDLTGTSGNDSIVMYAQNASTLRVGVNGTTRSIAMSAYAGIRVDLGTGNDRLTATDMNRNVTVVGGTGNDTILTGSGDDSINAGDGNDSVDAGAGNDFVAGGNDNDILLGGLGNDSITGASGKDILYGGDGNDRLSGNNGVDVIYGEAGDDRTYGDAGDDRLDGGAGRDRMYGGDGNDFILGGSNNDHIYADAGNDTLTGSKGNDILEGGSGIDLIYNRDPGDTLIDIELGS